MSMLGKFLTKPSSRWDHCGYVGLVDITPHGCWVECREDFLGKIIEAPWVHAGECIKLFPHLSDKDFDFDFDD